MARCFTLHRLFFILISTAVILLPSCGNQDERMQQKSNTLNANLIKKDSLSARLDPILQKAPILNLVDTTLSKWYVVYIKDSAALSTGISAKLKTIYEEKIPALLKEKNIKALSAGLAWFTTDAPPFYFEAGMWVEKSPGKLPKPFALRTIPAGKAILAHYYGPYGNTVIAYEVLNDWLKTNNKKKRGAPFEIYVTPAFDEKGNAIDPFKVRTDIIFPYQ